MSQGTVNESVYDEQERGKNATTNLERVISSTESSNRLLR